MKGEWQRKSKSEAAWGVRDVLPALPPSMNRRDVPESVLPVTSWLLNNGAALGAT